MQSYIWIFFIRGHVIMLCIFYSDNKNKKSKINISYLKHTHRSSTYIWLSSYKLKRSTDINTNDQMRICLALHIYVRACKNDHIHAKHFPPLAYTICLFTMVLHVFEQLVVLFFFSLYFLYIFLFSCFLLCVIHTLHTYFYLSLIF